MDGMTSWSVGERLAQFAGVEGAFFTGGPGGYTLVLSFPRPTQEEREAVMTQERFEIRFVVLGRPSAIMMLVRPGALDWIDAPFTPHLAPGISELMPPPADDPRTGTALTLHFVDGQDGTLLYNRLLGLSNRFSRQLYGAIQDALREPFNKAAYDAAVNDIFARYETDDLVDLASAYCRFK
jgi:hypothetical protein